MIGKKALLEWKVNVPVKKDSNVKYFGNLKKEVIDAKICSHCGTCAAICPVYGIEMGDKPVNFLKWDKECIDDGACVRFCPRVDYKPLNGLGKYEEIVAAKSKRFQGQDGGMVTEIMATAMDMKLIGSALLVDRDSKWKPKPSVARSAKAFEKGNYPGSKYSFSDAVFALRDNLKTAKDPGVVGTPCMVSGYRKLQQGVQLYSQIKLIVSIFCMENFLYKDLTKFLKGKGIEDISNVEKMDIVRGKFIVTQKEGEEISFPVKEMDDIVWPGCTVCQDFTGVESDISVGSSGSEDGFSTVIIRTPLGKKILDQIREKDTAEFGEANIEAIEKSANLKIKMHPFPKKEG